MVCRAGAGVCAAEGAWGSAGGGNRLDDAGVRAGSMAATLGGNSGGAGEHRSGGGGGGAGAGAVASAAAAHRLEWGCRRYRACQSAIWRAVANGDFAADGARAISRLAADAQLSAG